MMKQYLPFVAKHRKLILDALDYIWKNPETGYKEWKTHAYLEEAFAKLGYELTLAGDIPGFTAEVDTGKAGPTIAVFGELDALINRTHPECDPETGAVHSCGHCCQSAALLGLAAALKEPGVLDGLCGKIRLIAVPAEELIEVEYRQQLREKGIIRYMGGKPEFMYRGLLDGVDMALMIHTGGNSVPNSGNINRGSNGCIAKTITFKGVSAHAGGSPHLGINALYEANLGLNAINALRETFKDSSHIRVHPIVTAGGDAVNAIPDTVRLESYVRGATMDEILAVNAKVNRALAASAAAMGGNVHLTDLPGYWPRVHPENARLLTVEAMEHVLEHATATDVWSTGCSDIGDVGAVMPAIHPGISGATGEFHGNNFYIADPECACVKSAQVQLVMLALLLKDDAARAKEIISEYQPVFDSMQAYFDFVDKINIDQDAVIYEDGNITLNYGGNRCEKKSTSGTTLVSF